jgi:transcriptional regulator GlxA family with amidase domain
MDRAIEEPLSRSDLGSIADVSLRQLDRLFVKQVGVALGTYYLAVRLQRARELILRSPLSIIEIAAGCGFQSASHFSRVYRARFGVSPSGERGNALAKFRAEPV